MEGNCIQRRTVIGGKDTVSDKGNAFKSDGISGRRNGRRRKENTKGT